MESKKKKYKTMISSEIMTLQNSIDADEYMLDGIKEQGATPFVLAQIEKVQKRNNSRLLEIDILTKRLKDLDTGRLEDEICATLKQEKYEMEEHLKAVTQRRLENRERKQEKSDISQAFYKKNSKADRESRWSKKDMQRSYSYYLKNSDSVPDYIMRNLDEMPNNKGYIWKGIMCFGLLPPEKNRPLTMFERQKGGILVIHEWTDFDYKVFHKKDKDKKILKTSEQRKFIPINLDSDIVLPMDDLYIPVKQPPPPTPVENPNPYQYQKSRKHSAPRQPQQCNPYQYQNNPPPPTPRQDPNKPHQSRPRQDPDKPHQSRPRQDPNKPHQSRPRQDPNRSHSNKA